MAKSKLVATPTVQNYYSLIEKRVKEQMDVAGKAKKRGFDVSDVIECQAAEDLADRTEKIIGPKGVAQRYREVLADHKGDRMQTIFQLFKEIIEQQWCVIPDRQKRLEQAIKTGLVLSTEGVVVAPLDGVPEVRISKNPDGSTYVNIFYAGPIRAAGGTATVLPLILGDYARLLMGLDRYKPTRDEIERYIEECQIYDEIVTRQYKVSEDEVRKIIHGCTVCINGEPTEKREVAVHRDLPRVETNRIRGGACLVISEGVALKARKILKISKIAELDWNWLEGIIKVDKQSGGDTRIKPNPKYLEGAAAGRPIFCYPQRWGGFRLRYGRARNMGLMGKGLHPATMEVLDEFVAVGTQIKVERPGKAAGAFPVDSIDGPIVRLKNGNVVQFKTREEAIQQRHQIERVLYLGDLLVCIGDFRQAAHPLVPAGYCHEWYQKELEKAGEKHPEHAAFIDEMIQHIRAPSWEHALEGIQALGMPLHPAFVGYYNGATPQELQTAISAVREADAQEPHLKCIHNDGVKRAFEQMGIPHTLKEGYLVFEKNRSIALRATFGVGKEIDVKAAFAGNDNCTALSQISGMEIRDIGGTFIGSRMGRPEQSKPRKMIGNPHVLFPIGLHGGSIRSINKTAQYYTKNTTQGAITVDIASFKCDQCATVLHQPYCKACEKRIPSIGHGDKTINVKNSLDSALQELDVRLPDLVKGVKGLINDSKIPEPLEKGVLRAKHDVHIFRDGTIRFEAIDCILTHFTPAEIGTSVEQLKEMGYTRDREGNVLEYPEQIVELFPQDIVINHEAGDFFVRVTQFADDLLQRFYKEKPYFNITHRDQLIGELLMGLAPHTSAGVVCRVIGFTHARGCFGHPYFHQAKRRNIDGDQDSLLLLMDGLLNFSESYLPGSRGGRMDAPLVFTLALKPTEIDDECYNMDVCSQYPLELYEKAQEFAPPYVVENIERVEHRLNTENQYSGFQYTHPTTEFDNGPGKSRYITLTTMEEKVIEQAELQTRIAAVDTKDSLEKMMNSHLMPDIIGNARAFSRQQFRCTSCNTKFRRMPLSGQCECGKENSIILTIAQGSVKKYLEIAKKMANQYDLGPYLQQRIGLIEAEIDSVFKPDKVEQKSLFEFV
jgi:DNA polymerase II large subunit